MKQQDLIEWDGVPASRNRQSIEAAKAAKELHSELQKKALKLLRDFQGGLMDWQLWNLLKRNPIFSDIEKTSVVSTRYTLVRKGLVYNSGVVLKSRKGRNCTVWRAVR